MNGIVLVPELLIDGLYQFLVIGVIRKAYKGHHAEMLVKMTEKKDLVLLSVTAENNVHRPVRRGEIEERLGPEVAVFHFVESYMQCKYTHKKDA